jgi:hypothetical protein
LAVLGAVQTTVNDLLAAVTVPMVTVPGTVGITSTVAEVAAVEFPLALVASTDRV